MKKNLLASFYSKSIFFLLILFFLFNNLFGQITVSSSGGTGAPSTGYTTLAAAITAINGGTAHTGTITCNINAGYTETLASATAGNITATGTLANPITFQKNGAGANPIITANGSGTKAISATGTDAADYIISITGGDYITFDGIDLVNNSGTETVRAEYGYYIQNLTTTNGAQNNTIKNCVVDMKNASGTATTSAGIGYIAVYQSTLHAVATAPSAPANANNNNSYKNITVFDSRFGIVCYNTTGGISYDAGTLIDGCTIGNAATANDIGNGTSATALAQATINGAITLRNNSGCTISNNTIQNVTYYSTSGSNAASAIHFSNVRGICDVKNNKINNITNPYTGGTGTRSIGINAIGGGATDGLNIYNNLITNFSNPGAATTSLNAKGIFFSAPNAACTFNIYFNTIDFTTTVGQVIGAAGIELATTGIYNIKNNIFYSATSTAPAGSSSTKYCIKNPTGGTVTTDYNDYYYTLADARHLLIITTSNPDVNSVTTNPNFTGSGPTPYKPVSGYFLDGVTLGAPYTTDITGFIRPTPSPTTPPHMGCYDEADKTPIITLASANPAIAATDVAAGSLKTIIYPFTLTVTDAKKATLSSFNFTTSGTAPTYVASDVTKFQLWVGTTNTFASATQLGSDITTGLGSGPHTFAALAKDLLIGNTYYFWITTDISLVATINNNINVSALTNADITYVTGTKAGTAFAGADQTIKNISAASDYFRSISSGNWGSATTWESSHDNISWISPATLAPTATAINAIVQSGHIVTVAANLSAPNTTVNTGGELTSSGPTITPAATKTITVNGKLSVTAATKVLVTTSANLIFGAGALFSLNANGGYMPPAAWDATSTAYITGWTTATTLTADNGLASSQTNLVGQPAVRWGNLTFDFPGLTTVGKIFQGFNSVSGTAGAITINGNLTLLRTGALISSTPEQMFTSSGATGITCETFNINCGNWTYNVATTVNVNKSFRMVDSLSLSPGYSIASLNFSGNATVNTNVKGDFIQTIGNITSANVTAQSINFIGTTAQNATFNSLTNEVDINVNNAAGVNLLSNLTMPGTLSLTTGVFNVANNNLTFISNAVPIIRDGVTTVGTITMGSTSSLAFGATGFLGGAAFTIPAVTFTSGPSIANLTINRTNALTLNTQGMELSNALTLTAGVLNIGAGALLNLNGASLSSTTGTLAGTNTSDFTVAGNTGGTITLPQAAALTVRNFTISGNRSVIGNASFDINLAGALSVGANSTFTNIGENSINNSGGTGTISITGKFITQDAQGLYGTSTSIPTVPITFNTGSTVEYGGANQAFQDMIVLQVTGLPTNIIFSGSGTKTGGNISTTNPGLITIKNGITVDATSGIAASFGVAGTALTMEANSYLKVQGGTTQPNASGAYILAATSTIEFSGTSATTIRSAPIYGNIIVSGTNVGLSGTGTSLGMQNGTIFTVKNGATFNVQNLTGFSGGVSTAVGNTNTPTIVLETNSTINYNATANQLITTGIVTITPATSNYYNLKIDGSGTKTAPATSLVIAGNLTGAGTAQYVHNNGTLVTNGTAGQTYTSTTPFSLYNLTNGSTAAGGGFTINSNLIIEKEITLSSLSKINLNNGDITLKSDVNATASLAAVPNEAGIITYPGSGRFNVQRYLDGIKAWRFLATPINIATSPTITDTWREGGTGLTSTGFGTRITGPAGPFGTGNNYDEYSLRSSMKSYDMNANTFIDITAADLNTGKKIANEEGYFLFVRGDRGVDINGIGTPTTLQIKGQVLLGDQTYSVSSNKFKSIGNPYASRIDMRNVTFNNVAESFYLWNPTAAGLFNVGKYETYVKVGTDFIKVPGATVLNTIENGQAFIVANNTGAASDVVIHEADKTTGSSNVSRAGVTNPTLEINLNSKDTLGNNFLADGVMINFENSYSNDIDGLDVKKVSNTYDNLSIKVASQNLAVERRKTLTINDTIRLNLSGLRTAEYSFNIDPSVLSNTGLTGYLLDKFLQTETEISLSQVTNVNFTTTSNATSKAADRFIIVFRQTLNVLPVQFVSINVTKITDKINVIKWTVENEINIQQYEVERSENGVNFSGIHNIAALQTNMYSYIDAVPFKRDYYYRVKATSINGHVQYSQIVKVLASVKEKSISVFPNPVENGLLNLVLNNHKEGMYNVAISNNLGQVLLTKTIEVKGNIFSVSMALGNKYKGNGQITITSDNGTKEVLSFFAQ